MFITLPFRNEYFRVVHDLWTRCIPASGGRLHIFPAELMETAIFGSMLFDYDGLQIAWECDNVSGEKIRPVGLIHVALVPKPVGDDQNTLVGVVCLMLTVPDCPDAAIVRKTLLDAGEQYAIGHGIRTIYGGAFHDRIPFYCGFYAAGDAVGVLASDNEVFELFKQNGYSIESNVTQMQQPLQKYMPKMTMKSVVWSSKLNVQFNDAPKPQSWWDAQRLSRHFWLEAIATTKQIPNTQVANALVCIPSTNKVIDGVETGIIRGNVAELIDAKVSPELRKKGIMTYLLSKLLTELTRKYEVNEIKTQVSTTYKEFIPFLTTMNWKETDNGAIFVKEV
ncbi:MAG: GNAT family N-acetyltransferase [Planctomycetaceae bacterium]|jgi:hypothetical protein|nr:GNAT family N-acetyltransferase [Planctomycetaceae bacterium]